MPKKPIQGPCCVLGCGQPIEVRNWCGRHYRMQRLYGRTEKKNTGDKFSHPLYRLWWDRLDRGSLCEEWAIDFWAFARGVGERPSPQHLLRTIRHHERYGPQNFQWMAAVKRGESESTKEFSARKWKGPIYVRDPASSDAWGSAAACGREPVVARSPPTHLWTSLGGGDRLVRPPWG